MLRKLKFGFYAMLLILLMVGCSTTKNVELPSESNWALKSEFGEEQKKYLIEGNRHVCLYSLKEEEVFFLITENTYNEKEVQLDCYANGFSNEITGTPIAIATDLSSVIIENENGMYQVSCNVNGVTDAGSRARVTEFNPKDLNEFLGLVEE